MCEAAQDENCAAVQALIRRGANVNMRNNYEAEGPLHFAAEWGNCGLMRMLLDAGADANATCDFTWTPLFSTTLGRSVEAVDMLIRAGASLRTVDSYGRTPLSHAIEMDCDAIACRLLDAGADPNQPKQNGTLPLQLAGSVRLRWRLLAAGARPEEDFPLPELLRNPYGPEREMYIACLLEARHDARLQTIWGCSPLHVAALAGASEAVQRLLDAGASPNDPDSDGCTPLFWALDAGHREIVRILLVRGAKVEGKDGADLLRRAVEQHEAGILGLLLDSAGTANLAGQEPILDREHSLITPLHRAAELGDAGMMRILLEAGACINSQDALGRTPLSRAVRRHAMPTLLMLLEWGADLNLADEDGTTPLHLAAEQADETIVRLLLTYGANPQAQDAKGQAPEDRLPCDFSKRCRNLLKRAIDKPWTLEDTDEPEMEEHYMDELSMALYKGNTETVVAELEEGLDPNSILKHGGTVFYWAVYHNRLRIVSALIQYGADVNLPSRYGQLPLEVAHTHAMRTLLRRHGARLTHEQPSPNISQNVPAH